MNGTAVNNNGLRSPNGYFWPDQPYFRPKNNIQDMLKDVGARILVRAGEYVVSDIVLPALKDVVDNKLVPFIKEKIGQIGEHEDENLPVMVEKEKMGRMKYYLNRAKSFMLI